MIREHSKGGSRFQKERLYEREKEHWRREVSKERAEGRVDLSQVYLHASVQVNWLIIVPSLGH